MFSSFSPEVCILLRRKQGVYRVMFLVMEGGGRPWCSVASSIHFASMAGLHGVVCESGWVSTDAGCVDLAHTLGMELWTYGAGNTDRGFVERQLRLGVDRVITDAL